MTGDALLELAEAAKILGVHQSTLRRWADAGKVAHIRTLSGRRRFQRAVLEQARELMTNQAPRIQPLAARHKLLRPAAARKVSSEPFEARTLTLARQRTSELAGQPSDWLGRLNEEQRLLFRYSGQRLLGLMMQFTSRTDSAETFLEEGRRMAADYGRICQRAGLSLAQTAEAFLYFRRSILESVQATAQLGGPHDEGGRQVFLRTIDFFDALLVATIDSYAKLNAPESTG